MGANFNYNKTILGGRLTAAPELKQTPNGTSVTNFTIAVNRKSKEEGADFFNCTAFGKTAEFVCQYFGKGSSICVEGQLRNRSWTDKQGNKRFATDIMVGEVNFVDGKSDSNNAEQPQYTQSEPRFVEIKADDDLPF